MMKDAKPASALLLAEAGHFAEMAGFEPARGERPNLLSREAH